MNDNQRIGWDYELTEEDTKGNEEIVVLPDGEYDATITKLERGQFKGSTVLQPGPMAILWLEIDGGELGTVTTKANVILNQKLAWKLDQLAIACGFWAKGEGKGKRVPWSEVPGCRIRVQVTSRTYQDKTYQEVKKFLPLLDDFPTDSGNGEFNLPDEV